MEEVDPLREDREYVDKTDVELKGEAENEEATVCFEDADTIGIDNWKDFLAFSFVRSKEYNSTGKLLACVMVLL